ncbi:MAG: MarR family transcriptional regulator [Myxococcota bacterium]|nr:MarR family transcriptional regulator [Myxococcota bacterium]
MARPDTDPELLRALMLLQDLILEGAEIDVRPRRFDTPTPLSRAEIHTLSEIADCPGLGTSELAERLRVTKGAISQMLKRLEQKGLLEREAVGRRVSLEPTALGWRAHRAHQDFHLRQAEVLGAQYSDPGTLQRDREALERLLAGVRAFGAQDQS